MAQLAGHALWYYLILPPSFILFYVGVFNIYLIPFWWLFSSFPVIIIINNVQWISLSISLHICVISMAQMPKIQNFSSEMCTHVKTCKMLIYNLQKGCAKFMLFPTPTPFLTLGISREAEWIYYSCGISPFLLGLYHLSLWRSRGFINRLFLAWVAAVLCLSLARVLGHYLPFLIARCGPSKSVKFSHSLFHYCGALKGHPKSRYVNIHPLFLPILHVTSLNL